MARAKPLGDLSDTELLEMLDQAKDEATNLRFQHVTGQLDNVNVLSGSRRHVARILTELRVREISAAESAPRRRSGAAAPGAAAPGVDASGSGSGQESIQDQESTDAADRRAGVFKRRRRSDG